MIQLSCPSCSRHLQAPDDYAGKVVRCPYCKGKVPLPDAPAPTLPQTLPVVEVVDSGAATGQPVSRANRPRWHWIVCFVLTLLVAVLNVMVSREANTDTRLMTAAAVGTFWVVTIYVLARCLDRHD